MVPKNPALTHRVEFEAQDPDDQHGTITVSVNLDRMKAVAKRGKGPIMEMSEIVPDILLKPEKVFRGIRWEEDDSSGDSDGWIGYCGRPKAAYVNGHGLQADAQQRDPYDDEVFVVFVNRDKVAYNWCWIKCDQDDVTRPENHIDRFCEEVFP